ncbi:DEKNAAC103568, partial [Brettanomyces naardenensis]
KIHLSHYLAGWFFYVTVNLHPLLCYLAEPRYQSIDYRYLLILPPFLLASVDQYRNHLYLSRLVKYNIPKEGLFRYVCCAHYLDEIIIYLCYSVVLQTFTALLILLWVIVNLSMSANQSYKFYEERKKDGKWWRILPFIY